MPVVADFKIPSLPKIQFPKVHRHWAANHKEQIKWRALVLSQCKKHFLVDYKAPSGVLFLERWSAVEPPKELMIGSFKPIAEALSECKAIDAGPNEIMEDAHISWVYQPRVHKGFIRVRLEIDAL